MMLAPAVIAGSASRHSQNVALRFVRSVRSHSSVGMSSIVSRRCWNAALLTSTSRRPNPSRAIATTPAAMRFILQVSRRRDRASAGSLHQRDGSAGVLGFRQVGHHHVRALVCEGDSDRLADAAIGTRDDRREAGESAATDVGRFPMVRGRVQQIDHLPAAIALAWGTAAADRPHADRKAWPRAHGLTRTWRPPPGAAWKHQPGKCRT